MDSSLRSLVLFVDWDEDDAFIIERIGILMDKDPSCNSAYVLYEGKVIEVPGFLVTACNDLR
jgi:hypothetical protein